MRLDEGRWVLGGGVDREWKSVRALRVREAHAGLKRLGGLLRKGAPAGLKRYKLEASVSYLLSGPPAVRDALAMFPAFDCWLSIGSGFEREKRSAQEWELHFPFLQSFAAAKALLTGAKKKFEVRLDPEGRFHLTGSHLYFEFPKEEAGSRAVCETVGGAVRVTAASGRRGTPRELAAITETLWVDYRDPLILQPIRVHGVDRPGAGREKRFAEVLSRAMGRIEAVDKPLCEEISDFLRIIVPLDNPVGMGSVSSSYRELRGAFCLSHTDDELLQAETIVHEFCHQKLNLLFAVDPLIRPGQGGEVVYSPLRPDPRRLHGMLLGAHAFVNVGRYLIREMRERDFSDSERAAIELNTARRLFHVELMLRSLSGYADLTDLGRRFTMRMWRELMLQYHDMLSFDPKTVAAARKRVREHQDAFRLGDTGLHSGAPRGALKPKKKRGAAR
jgi:HEXXH motif-containing protein